MMGVAPVLLGIPSFHATFSLGLHRTGRFCSPLIPFSEGPRPCGQFSAYPTSGSSIIQVQHKRKLMALYSDPSASSTEERKAAAVAAREARDRKSTRLISSH